MLLTKHYQGEEIKEGRVGKACGTNVRGMPERKFIWEAWVQKGGLKSDLRKWCEGVCCICIADRFLWKSWRHFEEEEKEEGDDDDNDDKQSVIYAVITLCVL